MSNLYELTNDFLKLQYLAESIEDEQLFKDTLDSLEMEIEVKLENTAKVIRNIEGQIEMLKNEERRLNNRRKPLENSVKRLKENIHQSMIAIEKKKIQAGIFNFSIAKNPPALNLNQSKIPKQYFIEQPSLVDKATIRLVLKEGGQIPGAQLVQSEGVRIK